MTDIYSVEGVTRYIRQLLEDDPPLNDIWVEGEVSNMKAANSGHWYFTIKDSQAALKCVMFKSNVSQQIIEPHDGDTLRVHGRISVYTQRGEYQLYADQVQMSGGIGDLYQRFEALKAQLLAEGLFEADRKRPLPLFPQKIGIVTSPDAAAFRDVQNVLARRFPLGELILSPTLVQGAEAPAQIVRALHRLIHHTEVDVILMVRGGGSIEDLWAFNDEALAYAIAECPIPIVTGVGHETDFTIADFVADGRAPTPSAAAEIVTPNLGELRAQLTILQDAVPEMVQQHISQQRQALLTSDDRLTMLSPQRYIAEMRQRLDDLSERFAYQTHAQLVRLRDRLHSHQQQVHAHSPDAVLQRGYAIVTRSEDGTIIQQMQDVHIGEGVTIQWQDGEHAARIEDKNTHGHYKRTLF